MAPMFVLELLVSEVLFAFAPALGVPDELLVVVEVWLDVAEVVEVLRLVVLLLDVVVVVSPTGRMDSAAWIVNGLPGQAYRPPVQFARD